MDKEELRVFLYDIFDKYEVPGNRDAQEQLIKETLEDTNINVSDMMRSWFAHMVEYYIRSLLGMPDESRSS